MKQYEYNVITNETFLNQRILNKLGMEGWSLASHTYTHFPHTPDRHVYTFKRDKASNQDISAIENTLLAHTTGEYDKEWLLPRAFKKESGEYIPNGYNVYIKEKEIEKISEDEARIREILNDPSSIFVGYSQEGYNLHIWINQGKKYYIEPELNRINRIER